MASADDYQRFEEWAESQGYELQVAFDDKGNVKEEDSKWIHKNEGIELIEREATLGSRNIKKLGGLAKALYGDEDVEKSITDYELSEEGVTNAFESAIEENVKEVDTKTGFLKLNSDEVIEKAEESIGARAKIIEPNKEDVERIVSSKKDEYEVARPFAERIEKAKTKNETDAILEDFRALPEGPDKEFIKKITGIREPVTIIVPEGTTVIDKRPVTSWSKAKDRIDRNLAFQEEARELSAEDIKQGSATTIPRFADFWGWDRDNPDDLKEVRDLLERKGIEIKTTPSGQERIVKK